MDKSYSAGLTRQSRKTDEEMPFALWEISVKLMEHADPARLTEILNDAAAMDGVLNTENLETAITLVEELIALLSEVNGTGKRPTSFAAKFLHFASRAIPPWDRFAKNGMAVAMRKPVSHMDDYRTYATAFFSLLQFIGDKDSFTCEEVMSLDNYLLYWAGNVGVE